MYMSFLRYSPLSPDLSGIVPIIRLFRQISNWQLDRDNDESRSRDKERRLDVAQSKIIVNQMIVTVVCRQQSDAATCLIVLSMFH